MKYWIELKLIGDDMHQIKMKRNTNWKLMGKNTFKASWWDSMSVKHGISEFAFSQCQMQQGTCKKKKKKINPQMQKQKFTKKNIFWCLHETPWSVMSAILHEWDMTFTVTLSMMSTYRKITCLNKINCHGQLHNHKNHTKCHPCIQNKKNKDKSSTGLTS